MYVNVSIVLGYENILQWSMFQVDLEHTFAKLLETALTKTSLTVDINNCETECKCYLSHDTKLSTRVEVPLAFIVAECCDLNGKCVRFILSVESSSSSSCKNAAKVMMSSAQRLHYPRRLQALGVMLASIMRSSVSQTIHLVSVLELNIHLVSRSLWLYRKLYLWKKG